MSLQRQRRWPRTRMPSRCRSKVSPLPKSSSPRTPQEIPQSTHKSLEARARQFPSKIFLWRALLSPVFSVLHLPPHKNKNSNLLLVSLLPAPYQLAVFQLLHPLHHHQSVVASTLQQQNLFILSYLFYQILDPFCPKCILEASFRGSTPMATPTATACLVGCLRLWQQCLVRLQVMSNILSKVTFKDPSVLFHPRNPVVIFGLHGELPMLSTPKYLLFLLLSLLLLPVPLLCLLLFLTRLPCLSRLFLPLLSQRKASTKAHSSFLHLQ